MRDLDASSDPGQRSPAQILPPSARRRGAPSAANSSRTRRERPRGVLRAASAAAEGRSVREVDDPAGRVVDKPRANNQLMAIWTWRGFASSLAGRTTVSTPSWNSAFTASALTVDGRVNERAKAP